MRRLKAPVLSPPPPRVYLYVRFSSEPQSKGDSVRRQRELGHRFAQDRGIQIDEILRITDEGVSAFRGRNRTRGALGGFLDQMRAGKIPQGSELWIEHFDRLSRDYLTEAVPVFLEILKAGMKIVTLDNRQRYDTQSLNGDIGSLITAVVNMASAHNQSAVKRDRGKEAWREKNEKIHEKKLTELAPAWLALNKEKTQFDVIPERVEIVRNLFRDRLRGEGVFRLAAALNRRKEVPWGRGKRRAHKWHRSYVRKILSNRAVLGEFQPHEMTDGKRVPRGDVIYDYFPPIISEDVFNKVQLLHAEAQKQPGRIGERVSNLFTWLARCGWTDMPATYVNKGEWAYLHCDTPLEDGRRTSGWPYWDFESRFLTAIGSLDLAKIFGEDEDHEIAQKEEALSAAKRCVAASKQELTRLLKALKSADGPLPKTIINEMSVLESKQEEDEREVERATADLRKARFSSESAREFANDFQRLLAERNDPDIRLALRTEIRRIVVRVDVFFRVKETDEERVKRESFQAALKNLPKGLKIAGGIPSGKPSPHMVVTFKNAKRSKRTITQDSEGRVVVYESDINRAEAISPVTPLGGTGDPVGPLKAKKSAHKKGATSATKSSDPK